MSFRLPDLDLERSLLFRTPKIAHLGVGARKQLLDEAKNYNLKNVLIVTDGPLEKAGIIQKITDILDAGKINYTLCTESAPEPTDIVVNKVIEVVRQTAYDGVIGIGGGSNMDTAKLAATMAVNQGTLDQFYGVEKFAKPGLPLILLPTTAGTGSEVTDVSVVTDSKTSSKNAIFSRHLLASVAIVDPELTLTCPPMISASSGMDALSHAIEARWSKIGHPLTSWLAIEAIRRIGKSLRIAVKDGSNLKARAEMSYAAYVAALAFAQAGVSSVHAAAYPLGVRYHLPHGLSNALMLPSIMKFNAATIPENLAETARALGVPNEGSPVEQAFAGAEAVKQLSSDIGIPAGLSKLEKPIPETELSTLAMDMSKITRLLVRNPRHIGEKESLEIYQDAF